MSQTQIEHVEQITPQRKALRELHALLYEYFGDVRMVAYWLGAPNVMINNMRPKHYIELHGAEPLRRMVRDGLELRRKSHDKAE